MNIHCPHCGNQSDIDDSLAGKVIDCHACAEPFLVPRSEDESRHCPNCAADMADSTVICLACGFNMDTGEFLQTRIVEEVEELPSWHRALNLVADLFPGLFKPGLLISAILCFCAAIGVEVLAINLMALGVAFEGIAIAAFGVVIYAQGVALILSGTFQFVNYAMNEFESTHWFIFCFVVFGPFVAIILTIMYVGPKLAAD